jgi:glycosyltransferase involved in cell wall biosynthesis
LTPAAFFALIASVIASTPVTVVTERSGLRDRSRWGDRTYRFLEDRLTIFADAAIANSRAGERFLQSRGIPRHKTDVVYNGVNEKRISVSTGEVKSARAELGISVDDVIVGVAASLTPAKDHRNFLKAAAQVAREIPEARFLIVGEGPLRQSLEQQAVCLGLKNRVIFAGQHPYVAPYIANFDLAVLPSNNYEGCSNFLLEAMGIGTPCVATAVGGNPELITDGENGLLVPARDPEALANAILKLLRQPELAERLARTANERLRRDFSLQRMVAEYTTRWETMLAKRGLIVAPEAVDAIPA